MGSAKANDVIGFAATPPCACYGLLEGHLSQLGTATSLRSLQLTTFMLGCIIPLEWRRNKSGADGKARCSKGVH